MFLSFPISPTVSPLSWESQRISVHEKQHFVSCLFMQNDSMILCATLLEDWCTRQIKAKAHTEFWEGWN